MSLVNSQQLYKVYHSTETSLKEKKKSNHSMVVKSMLQFFEKSSHTHVIQVMNLAFKYLESCCFPRRLAFEDIDQAYQDIQHQNNTPCTIQLLSTSPSFSSSTTPSQSVTIQNLLTTVIKAKFSSEQKIQHSIFGSGQADATIQSVKWIMNRGDALFPYIGSNCREKKIADRNRTNLIDEYKSLNMDNKTHSGFTEENQALLHHTMSEFILYTQSDSMLRDEDAADIKTTLSESNGLHQLIPYLVQFLVDQIESALKTKLFAHVIKGLQYIHWLINNKDLHTQLPHYKSSIISTFLSCLDVPVQDVGKQFSTLFYLTIERNLLKYLPLLNVLDDCKQKLKTFLLHKMQSQKEEEEIKKYSSLWLKL